MNDDFSSSYVPLFGKVLMSSLWREEAAVLKLFLTMLLLKDREHVVRIKRRDLRESARLGAEEFAKALRVLSSKDPDGGEEQEFDGKRIAEIPGGWVILNGEKYQREMRLVNDRARWVRQKAAQRERRRREKAGEQPEPDTPKEAHDWPLRLQPDGVVSAYEKHEDAGDLAAADALSGISAGQFVVEQLKTGADSPDPDAHEAGGEETT